MCSVWYLERGQVWTYHLSKLSFPRILFVVASAPFSCRSSWPTCGVFSARGSRAVLFVQTRTSRTLWSDVFLAICARKSTSAPENQDVTAMSICKASVLFLIAPMSFNPPHEGTQGINWKGRDVLHNVWLLSINIRGVLWIFRCGSLCSPMLARKTKNRCNRESRLNLDVLSRAITWAAQAGEGGAPLRNESRQRVFIS